MRKKIVLFVFLCLSFVCSQLHSASLKKDSLKIKKSKPEYELSLLKEINTKEADFGAVPYQGKLVYVTSQLKDLVQQQSTDRNGVPYTDVAFFSPDSSKIKKPSFLTKVNSEFHDGPLAFASNETEIYVTRVEYRNTKARTYTNRAKLLVFKKNGSSWTGPVSFKYNNDSYSIGHASVSEDGRFLFFSSDMPGGFGGKDIYVCEKEGNDWAAPKNLGKEINTSSDEEFPYIKKDGLLFFASNGHKGFGGFDIFSANFYSGNWHLKRNEGAGLNSEGDDFGIVFADSTYGYVASNRSGGIGKEDIYRFTYKPNVVDFYALLLLTQNSGNPAKQIQVYLLNRDGQKIDSTKTGSDGFFRFNNLENDKQYMVSVEPDDIEYVGKARFYIANAKGNIISATKPLGENNFVFEHLPFDKSTLSDLYPQGDMSLAGCLSYNSNGSTVYIDNAKLSIANSFGDVTDTTHTNKLGSFVFRNLVSGQDYILSINDSLLHLPDGTVVVLNDKNGQQIKTFIAGKDIFKYQLLSPDKNVLSALSTNEEFGHDFQSFITKKPELNPKRYQKIYLMDKGGRLLDSVYTSSKGFFKFKNLETEKDYLAYFTEEDNLKMTSKTRNYYLVDEKGNVLAASRFFGKNKFAFNNLVLDSMGLTYTDDDNLNLAGSLRYGNGKGEALKDAVINLSDENGTILESVITNNNGCFLFKTLPAGKNYMISIDKSTVRIPEGAKLYLTDKNGKLVKTFSANGSNFNYKILGVEKNAINELQTSDDDLIVKIKGAVRNGSNQNMKIDSVKLIDKNGGVIETVQSNNDGRFEFNYAKVGDVQAIELLIKNAKDSVIYLTDEKGNVVATLNRAKDGTFQYNLLETDKQLLGEFSIDDPWLKVGTIKKDAGPLVISENLFYETNSYKFDAVGRKVLDKVIQILQTNPDVIIELSSYTDSRADDAFNLKLSDKRAQYAVNYIISKGVSKARLKAKGYGESQPLNGCVNGVNCSEKDHAINRRTEFKIVLGVK